MSIELPEINKHDLLVARNLVQTEALKEFLADRFSDENYEAWLLHYANDLHEIVEQSLIMGKITELAVIKNDIDRATELTQSAVSMIVNELYARHLELAA
ncbi:MAG: hypothetical protein NTY66_01385 [Candidatus Vogelbacteria bacterium]|nr:hypothetical protein [Candidatus Vogelbacteria bacterium]